jgi:hypothetical protein
VRARKATFANSAEELPFLSMLRRSKTEPGQPSPAVKSEWIEESDQAALLALFRLLVREPPRDHDFRTCPICKRYGITKI